MAVGGKVARMSLKQLNVLLARALDDLGGQGLTVITKDDALFKPWLPESYWTEQRAAELIQNATIVTDRRTVRQAEGEWLMTQVSVADVLEDGIPTLWKPLEDTTWGTEKMQDYQWKSGRGQPRYRGNPQPDFHYECYQCGRPITEEGKDHAGKTRCDQALLDREAIENGEYWYDHRHGEEEDEE